jgi:predicted dehydrogenase
VDVRQERDETMTAQLRAFATAVAGGDGRPLATLADGVLAVSVVDAAHRSARSGAFERILLPEARA